MQNCYTGDIGDFVKYAILRNICKQTNLRLGVNWYLVPDEEGTNDGRLTGYLFNDRRHLRGLDPPPRPPHISSQKARKMGIMRLLEQRIKWEQEQKVKGSPPNQARA